jgi:NTE family protein
MITKLVLSGGGINGIIFIGIIKYLHETNQLYNINTYVGSSIGAVINTLLCLGYTYDELANFILYFNFETVKDCDISNLFNYYGLDLGEKLIIILKCLIRNKLNIDDITLLQLYNKSKKNNVIITTCLSDKKFYYINHINYPSLSLITALQMSTCIPFYFKPVIFNNKYFLDGSVLNHFGIDYFNNDNNLFGVLLLTDLNSGEIKTFENYVLQLLDIILNNINYDKCIKNKKVLCIQNLYNILEFSITKDKKQELIEYGYNHAFDFFKKNN